MNGPFMLWLGNPCWVNPYAPEDLIVTVPRSWSDPHDRAPGVHVSATFATWSLLAAHAVANAYRPEGIP